ncbi:preprotein translocase subunit SecY [Candidatus Micrarchaeota archaeon]|nr:preprotein translocase subunit SecY [Candidatus Micrarchaeota archaeon]
MGVLEILSAVAKYLPEIKDPEQKTGTKEKLIWTGIALILFFMMYETTAFGVSSKFAGVDFLQTITASKIGSLLTAGIGPIVLASIFLQLFAGAGIFKVDMKDPKDKKKFLESQKVLALILALIEGFIFVLTSRVLLAVIPGLDPTIVMALVVIQIALGSVAILYLDELVTKYGLGSGISLFIAAGVAFAVFTGVVQLLFAPDSGVTAIMSSGGAEALPNAILALLPFGFTILVFLVVVYAESLKVEIPIAFERVRGIVPKLPLKYFYVSNIPVIFASALIINVQLFAGAALTSQFWTDKGAAKLPDITSGYSMDKDGVFPLIGYVDNQGRLRDGLLYFFTPVYGAGRTTQEHWNFLSSGVTPIFHLPEWLHAIVYVILLSLVSVLFGLFWVDISNMDAKSVAGQLTDAGMQIPGFRRDPRMLETILNKHILPLTIVGSFSVGILAGLADLTGALGTGTGILLTVGILARMYEQLEQMNAFDLYPAFGKMVGGE